MQQISGPAHRFRNCCSLLGPGTTEVKANRSPSQSLKRVRWRGAQMQMTKPADWRGVGRARWRTTSQHEAQHNRCYVSQSNECQDDDDDFILPSSSIMQPVVSDHLWGCFPDTTLGLRNEKLFLSAFNYPENYWCVSDELRREDHFGSGGCWGSIKDQYPLEEVVLLG